MLAVVVDDVSCVLDACSISFLGKSPTFCVLDGAFGVEITCDVVPVIEFFLFLRMACHVKLLVCSPISLINSYFIMI